MIANLGVQYKELRPDVLFSAGIKVHGINLNL